MATQMQLKVLFGRNRMAVGTFGKKKQASDWKQKKRIL